MGHLRLGRLPKTLRWRRLIDLLDASPSDSSAVARSTIRAAEEQIRLLAHDPGITYCFWLLSRIMWASRGEEFGASLRNLGVDAQTEGPVIAFIARLNDQVRSQMAQSPGTNVFSEIASLSFRRALAETAGQHTPSFFASSVENLRQAFREYSTRTQFGLLTKKFFGDFLSRSLRYFVEKEVSNKVGAEHALSTVTDNQQFLDSLDLYARQSARIVEEFAAGWYSKHNWESRGEITPEEAQRFVAVALRKLQMELAREGEAV